MTQHNTTTSVSLPSAQGIECASLIELRGPSGKCYGELDVSTGIIIFRRGKIAEHIDLTPYFKVVKGGK